MKKLMKKLALALSAGFADGQFSKLSEYMNVKGLRVETRSPLFLV